MVNPLLVTSNYIQRVYLSLTLLTTLATSLIYGINTIFLLDAGLTNTQAFLANAFFTVGQVIFEVPTGLVADLKGRRTSFLLGTLVLGVSTLMYLGAWQIQAAMWFWAVSSILLGLGYTFFSGATEAWLVDALTFTKHQGEVDDVFGRGQMMSGVAMLVGTLSGGAIAQYTTIAYPFILRAGLLFLTFFVAYGYMHDLGFIPEKGTSLKKDLQNIFSVSIRLGWEQPAVRWVMAASIFTMGTGFYVFYAMQPHLLKLYGDEGAYLIAGLAAALVACAQIAGGFLVPYVRKIFQYRTSYLIWGSAINSIIIVIAGITQHFGLTIVLLALWGLTFSAMMPIRQAFLNGLIPTKQRATMLSVDSLVGSSGGVITQPLLGRVADVNGYSASFLVSGMIAIFSTPFYFLAKKQGVKADRIS